MSEENPTILDADLTTEKSAVQSIEQTVKVSLAALNELLNVEHEKQNCSPRGAKSKSKESYLGSWNSGLSQESLMKNEEQQTEFKLMNNIEKKEITLEPPAVYVNQEKPKENLDNPDDETNNILPRKLSCVEGEKQNSSLQVESKKETSTLMAAKCVKRRPMKRAYTCFSQSHESIFGQLLDLGLIQPAKYRNPGISREVEQQQEQPGGYCVYHKAFGHFARSCSAFKDILENFIDIGMIKVTSNGVEKVGCTGCLHETSRETKEDEIQMKVTTSTFIDDDTQKNVTPPLEIQPPRKFEKVDPMLEEAQRLHEEVSLRFESPRKSRKREFISLPELPPSPSQILVDLIVWGVIKPFRQPKAARLKPMGINLREFCGYHNVFGHHTDNCVPLRCKIQELIQEGKLFIHPMVAQDYDRNVRQRFTDRL